MNVRSISGRLHRGKPEVIELGLTRTDGSGEERKAILVLKTGKDLYGGLKSNATVFWEGFYSRQHAFGLGGGRDFSKTLLQSPVCARRKERSKPRTR